MTLPPDPIEDNDKFDEKIALLLDDPVPMVSFTFGIPPRRVIAALQKAKSVVVQTVTTPDEAAQARDAGVDMLAVQAVAAGGHSGTLSPRQPLTPVPIVDLVERIVATVPLPVMAAGGLATPGAVADVIRAGAAAAVVGTVLLRAEESGASATHQAALTDPACTETVLTHAFTGRPARGLRNAFIDAHEAQAPLGYPAIHYLTSPLRKAAAAAGKPDYVHLWAGTGYRNATAEPTCRHSAAAGFRPMSVFEAVQHVVVARRALRTSACRSTAPRSIRFPVTGQRRCLLEEPQPGIPRLQLPRVADAPLDDALW